MFCAERQDSRAGAVYPGGGVTFSICAPRAPSLSVRCSIDRGGPAQGIDRPTSSSSINITEDHTELGHDEQGASPARPRSFARSQEAPLIRNKTIATFAFYGSFYEDCRDLLVSY
jgi:hypothetical protein